MTAMMQTRQLQRTNPAVCGSFKPKAHKKTRNEIEKYFGEEGIAAVLRRQRKCPAMKEMLEEATEDENLAVRIVLSASKKASEEARKRLTENFLLDFLTDDAAAGGTSVEFNDEHPGSCALMTKMLMTKLITTSTIHAKIKCAHELEEDGLLSPVQAAHLVHCFGHDMMQASRDFINPIESMIAKEEDSRETATVLTGVKNMASKIQKSFRKKSTEKKVAESKENNEVVAANNNSTETELVEISISGGEAELETELVVDAKKE